MSLYTFQALLLLTGVSDNVGGVKQVWSVLHRALEQERHFALVEEVPFQPQARIVIVSGRELGPTHSSLRSLLRS